MVQRDDMIDAMWKENTIRLKTTDILGVIAIDGPPCLQFGWAPDSVHDVARLLLTVYEDFTSGCWRSPPGSVIGQMITFTGVASKKTIVYLRRKKRGNVTVFLLFVLLCSVQQKEPSAFAHVNWATITSCSWATAAARYTLWMFSWKNSLQQNINTFMGFLPTRGSTTTFSVPFL